MRERRRAIEEADAEASSALGLPPPLSRRSVLLLAASTALVAVGGRSQVLPAACEQRLARDADVLAAPLGPSPADATPWADAWALSPRDEREWV